MVTGEIDASALSARTAARRLDLTAQSVEFLGQRRPHRESGEYYAGGYNNQSVDDLPFCGNRHHSRQQRKPAETPPVSLRLSANR